MFGKKPSDDSQALVPMNLEGDMAMSPTNRTKDNALPTTPQEVNAAQLQHNIPKEAQREASYRNATLETDTFRRAQVELIETLIEKIDFRALEGLNKQDRESRFDTIAARFISELAIPLNDQQLALLKKRAMHEVLGFGPIEPLLADPDVADIMINGHKQVYIEKSGHIYITDITFLSEQHLLTVIQRIVSRVGRRVDESNPMVDARMPDGSRFNAIIPPLAIDGCLVSIRKFKKHKMPLEDYVDYNSMSEQMAEFLAIASAIRLNIMVSGGTGSGKTTLLNALSGHIGMGERVITIEDAAELQLHQPHVLRLETRPASIEGTGEINQRQLVKNALRMRPDRIILGEIRGEEIIDMLSAMNTGHDGSMSTVHANSPRDCLSRVENLVGMSAMNMPIQSLRYQMASALHLIVQIQRMRDGSRRITHIEEVVGIEGSVISTQTIFRYKSSGISPEGKLQGEFQYTGILPKFMDKADYYGKGDALKRCLQLDSRQFG